MKTQRSAEDKRTGRGRWRRDAEEAVAEFKGIPSEAEKFPGLRAKFDLALARGLEEAIEDLVDSSDSNTRTMARLTIAGVALTLVIAIAGVAQVYVAFHLQERQPPLIAPAPEAHTPAK